MNSAGTSFLVSAIVAAGVSFAIVQYGGASSESPDSGPAEAQLVTGMQAELDELRDQLARLEGSVAESAAGNDPGPSRSEVEGNLDERIEAAVARALESARLATTGDVVDFDVDAAVAGLLAGHVNPGANPEAWKRIDEAGKTDEVIAAFKRIADENPGDADAQSEYGEALLAKVLSTEGVMDKAKYSAMADVAWSNALEIEPTHWSARFNKAVSYTFYPAFTGKPAEAVTHFETLMQQQEARPRPGHSGHVETYLMLGNMLQSQGKADRAMDIWQRGLQFHPGNSRLQERAGQ